MATALVTEQVQASLSELASLVRSAREPLRQIAHSASDSDLVADWLYENWYCASNDAGGVQITQTWFMAALGAALASTGRWETGWVALAGAVDGHIVAGRGAFTRRLAPGDYANIARPGLPVEPGDGLVVLDRLHWLDEPTGFWGARSLEREPPLPHKRLYISVNCANVCSVLRRLVPRLDAVQKPWSLKCPSDPQRFARVDALIVYVSRADWALFEPVLRAVASEVEPLVRSTVPPLTQPIATGFASADSPTNGFSFGQHCCKALATGVRGLLSDDTRDPQQALGLLQSSLITHGIDPQQPWVCN